MSLSQSATSQWGCGFHTLRVVLTRGISVFVPGFSALHMYGRTSDPGMVAYPQRCALALCTISSQSAIGR